MFTNKQFEVIFTIARAFYPIVCISWVWETRIIETEGFCAIFVKRFPRGTSIDCNGYKVEKRAVLNTETSMTLRPSEHIPALFGTR